MSGEPERCAGCGRVVGMVDVRLLQVLFPRLASVRVDEVIHDGNRVCVRARVRQTAGRCPACGNLAGRVHERYGRQLADTAVAGQRVLIRLQVRRFICDVAVCARRTFVEQVQGLTFRYGRVTSLLHETLRVIAAAVAGRPGVRLAAWTAIATSRSTLLRVLRAIPLPTHRGPAGAGSRRVRHPTRRDVRDAAAGHGNPPSGRRLRRPDR